MKPIRSLLFVPGSRPNWFGKILSYGADAVILDLEDSVPVTKKGEARDDVSAAIPALSQGGQRLYVRVNKGPYNFDTEDLEAVIHPGLEGIVLPKVNGPEDVDVLISLVSDIEFRKNMEIGATKFIVTLETARSIYMAYEIAVKDRVIGIAGISAKNGDVARSVGFRWTPEGLESLYLKSKVVLAARAAGVMPIGGLWQDVHDLDGLKTSALFNRQLGFAGELVLHPSNVPVINEVYSPSAEEIAYYKGMIETFEQAEKEGKGAVLYEGEHIDYAHVKTARQILEQAGRINQTTED